MLKNYWFLILLYVIATCTIVTVIFHGTNQRSYKEEVHPIFDQKEVEGKLTEPSDDWLKAIGKQIELPDWLNAIKRGPIEHPDRSHATVRGQIQTSDWLKTTIGRQNSPLSRLNPTTIEVQTEHPEKLNTTIGGEVELSDSLDPTIEQKLEPPDWLDTSEGRNYSDYGDGTCAENPHKTKLQVIMKRWIEISTQYDIKWFHHGGSLLGAWRNGDVIPHDTDLDILINVNDTHKLERIQSERNFTASDGEFHLVLQKDWKLPYAKRRRISCEGKRVNRLMDECSFQEPLGRLIKESYYYLDLWDYKIEDGYMHDASAYWRGGGIYLVDEIFPLKRCMFMGFVTSCPSNPKLILHEWYGKGMEGLGPEKICRNRTWVKAKYK